MTKFRGVTCPTVSVYLRNSRSGNRPLGGREVDDFRTWEGPENLRVGRSLSLPSAPERACPKIARSDENIRYNIKDRGRSVFRQGS